MIFVKSVSATMTSCQTSIRLSNLLLRHDERDWLELGRAQHSFADEIHDFVVESLAGFPPAFGANEHLDTRTQFREPHHARASVAKFPDRPLDILEECQLETVPRVLCEPIEVRAWNRIRVRVRVDSAHHCQLRERLDEFAERNRFSLEVDAEMVDQGFSDFFDLPWFESRAKRLALAERHRYVMRKQRLVLPP